MIKAILAPAQGNIVPCPGNIGPEARPNVAQRFSAGKKPSTPPSPGGTARLSHAYACNRVVFTLQEKFKAPPLGRRERAWFGCPSRTWIVFSALLPALKRCATIEGPSRAPRRWTIG